MRVVIQRAKNAKCTIDGQITGQIDSVSYTHLTLPTKLEV